MPLNTLDKEEFLTVNGIQTLSHSYLNLLGELEGMKEMGVSHFRLVPHTQDMVAVARIFRDALDNTVSVEESREKLASMGIPAPFSNGFWHGKPGHHWVGEAARA